MLVHSHATATSATGSHFPTAAVDGGSWWRGRRCIRGDAAMAARTCLGARDEGDSRAAVVVVRSRSRLRGGVNDERLLVCCCVMMNKGVAAMVVHICSKVEW